MDQGAGATLDTLLSALGAGQLGFQPAALLGQQSIAQQRQQIYGIETVASFFQPNSVNSNTISSIGSSQITSGTLTAVQTLGSQGGTLGSVTIDGQNQRIVINDGTTNRIVIGNV